MPRRTNRLKIIRLLLGTVLLAATTHPVFGQTEHQTDFVRKTFDNGEIVLGDNYGYIDIQSDGQSKCFPEQSSAEKDAKRQAKYNAIVELAKIRSKAITFVQGNNVYTEAWGNTVRLRVPIKIAPRRCGSDGKSYQISFTGRFRECLKGRNRASIPRDCPDPKSTIEPPDHSPPPGPEQKVKNYQALIFDLSKLNITAQLVLMPRIVSEDGKILIFDPTTSPRAVQYFENLSVARSHHEFQGFAKRIHVTRIAKSDRSGISADTLVIDTHIAQTVLELGEDALRHGRVAIVLGKE